MNTVLAHPQYSDRALAVIHQQLATRFGASAFLPHPSPPIPVVPDIAHRDVKQREQQIIKSAVSFTDSPLTRTAIRMAYLVEHTKKSTKKGYKKKIVPNI